MAKRKDRREAAAAQTALQGPLTKEDSLAEVSLQTEAAPAVISNVVLQSKNKRILSPSCGILIQDIFGFQCFRLQHRAI